MEHVWKRWWLSACVSLTGSQEAQISFLGVSEGVSGERSIQISGLGKVDPLSQCGWALSRVLSKTREEGGGIFPLFPCLTVGSGTAHLVLCLQSSWVPSLWTWDLTTPRASWAPACRWQMRKFSASIRMQPIPHFTHPHTHSCHTGSGSLGTPNYPTWCGRTIQSNQVLKAQVPALFSLLLPVTFMVRWS